MIWLTWRQFRVQAAAVYVGRRRGSRVVLAVTGPRLADSTRRANVFDQLTDADRRLLLRRHRRHRRRAGADRRVLGRAAGRPRAGGRHPPAGVEPERHPHPLAGDQARPDRLAAAVAVGALASRSPGGRPRWTGRGAPPAVASGPADPGLVRDARHHRRSRTRCSRSCSASPSDRAAPVGAGDGGHAGGVRFVQIAMPLWVRPHLIPPAPERWRSGRTRPTASRSRDGRSVPSPSTATRPTPADWVLSTPDLDPPGGSSPLPSCFVECLAAPAPAPTSPSQAADGRGALDACLHGSPRGLPAAAGPTSRPPVLAAAVGRRPGVRRLSGLLAWFSFWWVRRSAPARPGQLVDRPEPGVGGRPRDAAASPAERAYGPGWTVHDRPGADRPASRRDRARRISRLEPRSRSGPSRRARTASGRRPRR